ncbi:hypothetical protein XELAEV_18028846mg, partial [Xenopus laevis]
GDRLKKIVNYWGTLLPPTFPIIWHLNYTVATCIGQYNNSILFNEAFPSLYSVMYLLLHICPFYFNLAPYAN